jgi:hypothetical protein
MRYRDLNGHGEFLSDDRGDVVIGDDVVVRTDVELACRVVSSVDAVDKRIARRDNGRL